MSEQCRLLRLPQVLELFPVKKSKWYEGVKKGVYPQPVRLSAQIVAWVESEIQELIQRTITDARGGQTK